MPDRLPDRPVSNVAALDMRGEAFTRIGYEVMGDYDTDGRRYFRTANGSGIRTHHLHIYETGSRHMERHLALRDYLIAHPSKAAAYCDLKAKLTSSKDATGDACAERKAPFILAAEQEALRWYRYARSEARRSFRRDL